MRTAAAGGAGEHVPLLMDRRKKQRDPVHPGIPMYPEMERQLRHIPSDVLGGYTGHPADSEHPVQDADDL